MSGQLYRIGDLNAFGRVTTNREETDYPLAAEYLSHLVEAGALVPVEIDYEAAAYATGMFSSETSDFARALAHRIVDAALGIGDDDE